MTDVGFPAGGVEVVDPVWDPWHPAEVADRLVGVRAAWCIAGGWALDLWRGCQSRGHEDVEIGIPSTSFGEVRRALAGYELDVVGAGRRWPLSSAALRSTHQTWVREPATGVYRLDIFREPNDGNTWICRRDVTIRLPYSSIIERSGVGVPYLVPEIVLLFKAEGNRAKDRADFDACVPLLGTSRRTWLREVLLRLHPDHPWLEQL